MTIIVIDPNVRTAGNGTYSGFEDVSGVMPAVDDKVLVRIDETREISDAFVSAIDASREIIYLSVDWRSFREAWWMASVHTARLPDERT